ncbi:hypothetical protein OAF27_01935 [Verrucomicrobiales bacterium]|nr:hypothetical protein [Verrucomicrobiales bacterium]
MLPNLWAQGQYDNADPDDDCSGSVTITLEDGGDKSEAEFTVSFSDVDTDLHSYEWKLECENATFDPKDGTDVSGDVTVTATPKDEEDGELCGTIKVILSCEAQAGANGTGGSGEMTEISDDEADLTDGCGEGCGGEEEEGGGGGGGGGGENGDVVECQPEWVANPQFESAEDEEQAEVCLEWIMSGGESSGGDANSILEFKLEFLAASNETNGPNFFDILNMIAGRGARQDEDQGTRWLETATAITNARSIDQDSFEIMMYRPDQVNVDPPVVDPLTNTETPFKHVLVKQLPDEGTTRVLQVLNQVNPGDPGNLSREYRDTPAEFDSNGNQTVQKKIELREALLPGDLAAGPYLRRIVTSVNQINSSSHATTKEVFESLVLDGGAPQEIRMSKVTNTYMDYYFGTRLVSKSVRKATHTGNEVDEITSYQYYTTGINRGRRLMVEYPSGNWVRYTYDNEGKTETVTRPWGNALSTEYGDPLKTVVTEYDYNDNYALNTNYNKRTVVKTAGTITSATYTRKYQFGSHIHFYRYKLGEFASTTAPDDPESVTDRLVTYKRYNPRVGSGLWDSGSNAAKYGRENLAVFPDGTGRVSSYSWDDDLDGYASETLLRTIVDEGAVTATVGSITEPGVITEGTRTTTWTTESGAIVKTLVKSISSVPANHDLVIQDTSAESGAIDSAGRVTLLRDNITLRVRQMGYTCCSYAWVTEFNGLTTVYDRDARQNVIGMRTGYRASQDPVDTALATTLESWKYTVDRSGRRWEEKQLDTGDTSGNTFIQRVSRTYGIGGNLLSETDAENNVTTYVTQAGGRHRFTFLPSAGEPAGYLSTYRMTYADGRTHVTRRATTALPSPTVLIDVIDLEVYSYEVLPATGFSGIVTNMATGVGSVSGAPGSRWTQTVRDRYGRVREKILPDGTSANATVSELTTYNNLGQLFSRVDPDGVTTLYGYDSQGRRNRVVTDLDGTGTITGTDRTTTTGWKYQATPSGVAMRTTVGVRDDANIDRIVSITDRGVDGLWQTITRTNGQVTSTTSYATGSSLPPNAPTTTPGEWQTATVNPDGSSVVANYSGGRRSWLHKVPKGATNFVSGATSGTSYGYDGYGRISSQSDLRIYWSTTFTYYPTGRTHTVTRPNPSLPHSTSGKLTTTYTYDSRGSLLQTNFPNGGDQYRVYHAGGQLKRKYGELTYDTSYTYEYGGLGGKMLTMTTGYGSGNGLATTTWGYNSERAWLESKTYPGGESTGYEYTGTGRLEAREWARELPGSSGTNVATSYGYDAAGFLETTDYNDSTPDVHYTYHRTGTLKEVRDGSLSGGQITSPRYTHSYTYDTFYPSQLLTEQIEGSEIPGGSRTLTRNYEGVSPTTVSNRYNGFYIGEEANPDHQVTYAYDTAGRLETVASGGDLVTYDYHSLSSLVDTVSTPEFTQKRNIRTGDNKVFYQRNSVGSTRISGYYTHQHNGFDKLGRRKGVSSFGIATPQGNSVYHQDLYTYNTTGEVTASTRVEGYNQGLPGAAVAGFDFGYGYDPLGNRLTADENGATTSYTPDARNQYDSVLEPGASTATTVIHDEDGNLLDDGTYLYTWNAENRLIARNPKNPVADNNADMKSVRYSYTYDYRGRRIQSDCECYVSGVTWAQLDKQRFIYDGWNPVAVYSLANPGFNLGARAVFHTWGLDLAAQNGGAPLAQAAGGVGGLLKSSGQKDPASLAQSTHFYLYDLNGNVTQVMRKESGGTVALAAHYEYDPFGNATVETAHGSTDQYAWNNPFRFATKMRDLTNAYSTVGFDQNSNRRAQRLDYYGFRYYRADTGRWLSRDPIGERGGVNLYSFVSNDPIGSTDFIGLCKVEIHYNEVKAGRHHAYLVITDTDGSRTTFRAGPGGSGGSSQSLAGDSGDASRRGRSPSGGGHPARSGANSARTAPFGPITAETMPYEESIDFRDTPEVEPQTVMDNDLPCDCVKEKLEEFKKKINESDTRYELFSANSNTAVNDALEHLGIDPPEPPVNAPAWDRDLF